MADRYSLTKVPMRTPKHPRSTSGFTLVELLTVIAIIAVLMGILFPTIGAAIEGAKKTQAKNDSLQLVNAIKGYYTEYGKYPTAAAADTTVSDADMIILLKELRVPAGYTPTMNPRKINFLEVSDAKNLNQAETKQKSGISTSGKWLDPWGTVYKVRIDADYDNQMTHPYTSNAGATTLSTGVIAWSIGRDGQGGAADKSASTSKDDVISWQ